MYLTTKQKWLGFVGWFLACMLVMAIGGVLGFARVMGEESWFSQLDKPAWTPSTFLLPYVWAVLFVLMTVAVCRVWVEREEPVSRLAVKFFVAGLILNVVWISVFFGFKNPGAAAIQCVVLWLTVFATFSLFWQRFKLAGLLILPYLICLTYAAYLNIMIWRMNA